MEDSLVMLKDGTLANNEDRNLKLERLTKRAKMTKNDLEGRSEKDMKEERDCRKP